MHSSLLVPVKVNITDQDREKVAETTRQYKLLSALSESADPNSIGRVAMGVEAEYCAAIQNAFAAAVFAAVENAMAPYAQDTEDPKLCVFEDETEYLKASFETDTVEAIQYGKKYYHRHELDEFRVGRDGVVRELTEDGQEFLSAQAKKMKAVTVPAKVFYKTFRKYADTMATYSPEHKAWGYYINPNAFYDWYSIGGRWQAPLLVKADCEEYAVGVPGALSDGVLPSAPDGYKWTSAARIKDIEWDAMVQASVAAFTQRYQKYEKIWKGQTGKDDFNIKPDGIYYFGTKVFDPALSLEEALARADYTSENVLPRMLGGYLDTRVICEPDEYGEVPSGFYSNECFGDDWNETVNNFVAEFDPDDVLVIVDYHS